MAQIAEGLKIGAWNVRTLKETGRLWQVTSEMKRYDLSILGISEIHWKGQGDLITDEIRMVYSGGERCERGVAILFDKKASERITEIEKISDRLMMVKVSAEPVDIVLIQVYMPTTKYEDWDHHHHHQRFCVMFSMLARVRRFTKYCMPPPFSILS